jgi:hypothetical protein
VKNRPKKSAGLVVNKTAEIRAVAREMIDKGTRPRPLEIVEELWRAKKIRVAGAQVSMALKGTGMEYRPKTENKVPFEDLEAVKRLLEATGSMDRALKAIAAYRELVEEKEVEQP